MWRFPDRAPLPLHVPEQGVTVTPLLGGPAAERAHYGDGGRLIAILYPLPGVGRLLRGELLPAPAALESLLGTQRATILRLLDRPRPAGRLAEALSATPGAATHHLKALETAGLIIRERDGRQVIVHRTARGGVLLGLYE